MNEAELVLSHILNCDRLSLYLNRNTGLDKDKSALVSDILKRRSLGEPIQYILGTTEFMGIKFKVDRRALIPRPETEILVESAIEQLKTMNKACPEVLDLGTGTGCIAISIAKMFPQAVVWASDISSTALELAKENACLNNAEIKFLPGDLFGALGNKNKRFDLIISNPPYIATSQLSGLAKEISFEPPLALDAGIDGLDFYRRIVREASRYLNDDGLLILEVGINQADLVKAMLGQENFNAISIIKDYNNISRVITAKKGFS